MCILYIYVYIYIYRSTNASHQYLYLYDPSFRRGRYADVQIQLCESESEDGKPIKFALLASVVGNFLVMICTLVALHSVMDFFMLQVSLPRHAAL